jgi:MYXO-CTERM domain-containing protein
VERNDGTSPWDSSTALATTAPRERNSIFAGPDWVSPTRAAHPTEATVAPGSDGTFEFSFNGPTGTACVPGQYHEFFGFVHGTTWFSESGGPPDNQIEAFIDLVDGTVAADMAGGGSGGGGGGGNGGSGGGGGGAADGGMPNDLGKPPWMPPKGGCSVAVGSQTGASLGSLILILLFVAYARRRSRSLRAAI